MKVALGEIMLRKSESVDPAKHPEEVFDLYSVPAFEGGMPEVVPGARIGSAKQLVRPGDILLSRIVPHIRRSWVVGANRRRRMIASGEWIVFRSERVFPDYLRHWLVHDGFHARLMRTVSGVGGSLLRARAVYVAQIEIELPSLPEQRRIASILDKADALRARRREVMAGLDALRQSIFYEMFGDPASNPKGWEVSTIGEMADVQGGLQVSSRRKALPREVPYLRVANVLRGRLDLREIKTMRATDAEILRTTLRENDLLLVEGHGNRSEIGRGALWDGSMSGCVHQNHLIRARFEPQRVEPLFACEFLNSPGGRRHLKKAGKTTSGLNTICVSDVRAAPLPVPPINLQYRFLRQVAAGADLRSRLDTWSCQADVLFTSLEQRAFQGLL